MDTDKIPSDEKTPPISSPAASLIARLDMEYEFYDELIEPMSKFYLNVEQIAMATAGLNTSLTAATAGPPWHRRKRKIPRIPVINMSYRKFFKEWQIVVGQVALITAKHVGNESSFLVSLRRGLLDSDIPVLLYDAAFDAVYTGLAEGLGDELLARQITTAIGDSRSKTRRLARWIGTSVYNQVQKHRMKTHAVYGSKWVSHHDDRVRATHSAADGQVKPLNEPFEVGGYLLDAPGDITGPPEETINCRCVLISVTKKGKEVEDDDILLNT